MLLKRQQVQMERLLKNNNLEKSNEIKNLTQDDHDEALNKLDKKQEHSVSCF